MASAVLTDYATDPAGWVRVKSSNVRALKYMSDFGYLFVQFKAGSIYAYFNVPPGVYQGFLSAPSKGEYLFAVIRAKGTDSRYGYERVG